MKNKRATVAIVPRERFSHSGQTIRSVIANTHFGHDLIFIDGKTPGHVMQEIEPDLEQANAKVISSEAYISPNKARNLAAEASETEYIVFLDNDTLVGPRWLDALVQCADETEATQVGPLQFIGDFRSQTLHIAGGMFHEDVVNGQKVLYDEQRLFEAKLKTITKPLRRSRCDYAEFHCMLMRKDFLDQQGGLDENMLSVHEHIDLALELRNLNKKVYFEPGALATYIPPEKISWFDLPYFEIRWSEDWTVSSVEHFRRKWGYDRLGYLGEESMDLSGDTIVKFVRGHRGSVAGINISTEELGKDKRLSRNEAELIVSGFLSVECRRFASTICLIESEQKQISRDITAEQLIRYFDANAAQLFKGLVDFSIRPLPGPDPKDPCLVRSVKQGGSLESALEKQAFMVLRGPGDSYEYWFAVALGSNEKSDGLARFSQKIHCQSAGVENDALIALSNSSKDSHRLCSINTGRILTESMFLNLLKDYSIESLAVVSGVTE